MIGTTFNLNGISYVTVEKTNCSNAYKVGSRVFWCDPKVEMVVEFSGEVVEVATQTAKMYVREEILKVQFDNGKVRWVVSDDCGLEAV